MSIISLNAPAFRRDAGLVLLATLPFFLNDFVFLQTKTALAWLAADYGSKLLALGIVFGVAPIRRALSGTLALKRPAWETAILALLAWAFIVGVDHFFRAVVPIEVEAMALFKYPKLASPVLYWTDVTYGLLLTAISEELVFRGVFAGLLARYFTGEAALALASAVLFASVHWSHGLTAMIVAFLAGLALMALYRRTGSLLPAMAAHYLVDLWDFA